MTITEERHATTTGKDRHRRGGSTSSPEARRAQSPRAPRTRTAEEVALQRLRLLAFGFIGAVMVLDACQGPLTRWRSFRRHIRGRFLDPLDASGTTLLMAAADLLSMTDGFGGAKKPE